MDSAVVLNLSRLIFGAVATFLAIILWSATRDTAWMFVIIGTIVNYGDVVLSTLESFGIVSIKALPLFGVSVFKILFANLPVAFFIVAFIIMLYRRRVR